MISAIFLFVARVLWLPFCWLLSPFLEPTAYDAHITRSPPARSELQGKRIAVIGAGFSGLAVCAALRRHGADFQCFERAGEIGGNWASGVYENVHIISSKLTTQYPDFPMPAHYPDFPSAAQMLAYLESYADHYRLREHIRLGAGVELVSPSGSGSNRWTLLLDDGSELQFDHVVVANGHHWAKRMAGPYPGQEAFEGQHIHSKDYKRPAELAGKRVLVIGGGNSACDIAVEAARFGQPGGVHLSVRRGYWFLPRVLFGRPLVEAIAPWMPMWLQRLLLRAAVWLAVGDYTRYGLPRPDHDVFVHHPTINSELLNYVKLGEIQPHGDVARFGPGRAVHFADGSQAEVDLVVHCTGFDMSLPLLARGVVSWAAPAGSGGRSHAAMAYPDLTQGIFPLRHRGLYVAGIGQPRYGIGPLVTAGAESLVAFMKAQERIERPVGRALRDVGLRPLETTIMDPHVAFTDAVRAIQLADNLHHIEAGTARGRALKWWLRGSLAFGRWVGFGR